MAYKCTSREAGLSGIFLLNRRTEIPFWQKSGVIYRYKCVKVSCEGQYIGESGKTFSGRYKEHMKAPSPTQDHHNTTGHDKSINNFIIVGREDHNLARSIKEVILSRVNDPPLVVTSSIPIMHIIHGFKGAKSKYVEWEYKHKVITRAYMLTWYHILSGHHWETNFHGNVYLSWTWKHHPMMPDGCGDTFPIKGSEFCLLEKRFECVHHRYTLMSLRVLFLCYLMAWFAELSTTKQE